MNSLKVAVLIAVSVAVAPVSADPPLKPDRGAGIVASNAGVSLDSDSPTIGQGEAIDAAPEEPVRGVDDTSSAATASPRAASSHSVVITRPTTSGAQKTAVPRTSWTWLTSGLMPLAAVLGVMGAIYWAVRRWVPAARAMDAGVLRVVSRAGLTPKHTVALVLVGRRFVLVGVSGDRIERLETIEDPQEVADLLAATQTSPANRGPFLETLKEESSSYVEAVEELDEPTAGRAPVGARATEQLGSLLQRLRRLQKN